jgi:hypothetical protein
MSALSHRSGKQNVEKGLSHPNAPESKCSVKGIELRAIEQRSYPTPWRSFI